MVLTDNTLELYSKHWHRQLQHQIWRELPTEAWTACSSCHIRWWNTGRVFSVWQGAGDGECPRSILADRASHIIPPTHHIASRHQIHQDVEPNWQWQQHTLPRTQYRGFWLHLGKAIKAWVRKTDKSEKWGRCTGMIHSLIKDHWIQTLQSTSSGNQ